MDAGYHRLARVGRNRSAMAEPRSPLREFRHLDEKLHTVGLSPPERARWESLRALVAPEPASPVAGFDVEAAARALRDSLAPAGLGTVPPHLRSPPHVAVTDAFEPAPEWPAETETPAESDPSLAAGTSDAVPASVWDAGPFAPPAPTWDPNAPAPEELVWDAPSDGDTASWGAEPAAGEPPASWAAPVAPWDPAAVPEGVDPAAAWEAPPVDGEGAPAEAAPSGSDDVWDPRSLAAELAPAWEPPAASPEEPSWPAAPAPAPAPAWGAIPPPDPAWAYGARAELFQATPAELASWEATAAPEIPPEAIQPEAAAIEPVAPEAAPAGAPEYGACLEFEDAAASAAPPAEPPPAAAGEVIQATAAELASWEATAVPEVPPEATQVEVSDLEPVASEASQGGTPEYGAYQEFEDAAPSSPSPEPPPASSPDAAPPVEVTVDELLLEDFEPDVSTPEASGALARLAAAAHAVPVEAGEEPLPGAELLGEVELPAAMPPPEPPAAEGPTAAEEAIAFAFEPDQVGGPGSAPPGASSAAGIPDRAIDLATREHQGLELASASEFLSFVGESPPGVVSLELERSREEPIPEVSADDVEEVVEPPAEVPANPEPTVSAEDAPASAPEPEPWSVAPVDASVGTGDVISLEEIAITPPPPHAEALAPPLPLPPVVAASLEPPATPAEEPAAPPAEPVASAAPPVVEPQAPPPPSQRTSPAFPVPARTPPIPPAAVPPPPPAPAREAPPASFVDGEHRVVLHTVEGQVLRGAIRDADLASQAVPVVQPSGELVDVPTTRLKALFFMLGPGEAPPVALGTKVRVTFADGRQIGGMSPDYSPGATGFFVIPVDSRTNTGRIWVYRAAVRQISVG